MSQFQLGVQIGKSKSVKRRAALDAALDLIKTTVASGEGGSLEYHLNLLEKYTSKIEEQLQKADELVEKKS